MAIAFHWVIAAVILFQIALGVFMSDFLEDGLRKFELFQLHKSVGLTILLLSLARLAWRLGHRPPPYAADVPGWQRAAAAAVHWAFYVLMVVIPLTGWVMVSASAFNFPTLLWGLVPWPHLPGLQSLPPETKETVSGVFSLSHEWLVRGILALFVLHVAAALKHQFVDRDETLWRMLPLVGRPRAKLSGEAHARS